MALDERGEENMTVTVIEANHCPGAVMFLFDGYFGRILYTGDFRYEPWMSVDTSLSGVADIDVLYLDNTYNCSACSFPSRSVATTMVCDIIRGHPQKDIVIGVNNLGKEDLLECVAETFHRWIGVSPQFYEKCTVLQRRNVFTTDVESTSIRAVPMHEVTRARLNAWNKKQPTIAILPTALYFAGGSVVSTDMFVVPYSDHSSYTELVAFVEHVKPRLIIPIVRRMSNAKNLNMSGITDIGHFSRHLDVTVAPLYQVPDSVTEWMKLAWNNSVGLRKSRVLSKKTLQRRRKCNEVEFTDESPVKRKRISPTTDLQQSRDQSYDKRELICVGHVRTVNRNRTLEKRKVPLSSVIDGNVNATRSKDNPSEQVLAAQPHPDSACGSSTSQMPATLLSNTHCVQHQSGSTHSHGDDCCAIEDETISPRLSSLIDTNTDINSNVVETEDNILSPGQKAPTENNNGVLSQSHISDVTSDIGDCTMDWLNAQDSDHVCDRTVMEPESSQVKPPRDIETIIQQRCVHDSTVVNDCKQKQLGNLHDIVVCADTLADTPMMTGECAQHTSRDSSAKGSPHVTSQQNISQHAQTSAVSWTETLVNKTSAEILTEAQHTDSSGDTWTRSQNSEMADDVCAETQNSEMFFDGQTESQNTETYSDTAAEIPNTERQNTETTGDSRIETQNTETTGDSRIETQNTETTGENWIESQNTETSSDTRIESQNTETPSDTRIESQNNEIQIETQHTETPSNNRIETRNAETQTSETFIDTRTKAQQFMQDSHRTPVGFTNSFHRRHSSVARMGPATPTLLYPATPRLLCYHRHSSVSSMSPASPRLLCSPINGNASTPCSATTNKHKLCKTLSTDNVIGSSVFETDPDVMMRLIDPLLDEEARRMSAGHSWVTRKQ